jgi:pimeloyl-ACP methyl ester carboxylesterase
MINPMGHPFAYDCRDTFSPSLATDALRLSNQITNYLKTVPINEITDIYLISHSLGGAVALSYLTALFEAPGKVESLPDNGNLAGVVTLDSPVGGVPSSQGFPHFVFGFFKEKRLNPLIPGCTGLTDERKQFSSVMDLARLFDTTSKPTFPPTDDNNPGSQGAHASILKAIWGGRALTNQGLAEEAAGTGRPVLTIGNTLDRLFNPGAETCINKLDGLRDLLGISKVPSLQFVRSQWIDDEGPEDSTKEGHPALTVYGREFTAGEAGCKAALGNEINHKEVYNNQAVEGALLQFLSQKAPTALPVAPPEP